jgi:antitoxin component of MazEF toxin-antitoxin module
MKLILRRIGNSVGVIVPKSTLETWGVGEGDSLELTDTAIRPPRQPNAHKRLDELKRLLSLSVVQHCSPQEIRARSLGNLHRWKKQGTWVSAYDEWMTIVESGSDGELFAAMLGRDDHSTRLRQSMPYVGLLPTDEVDRIREEAGA